MKHIKKHLQKISKETMKKGFTTLVLLFFAMVMIFQKDSPNAQMEFVWNADEVFMHNAASQQRDYLFQDEGGQTTYQAQISGTAATTTTDTMDSLINPDEAEQILSSTQTGQISTGTYTGTLYTGTISTGTKINTGMMMTGSLDCITPWREKVKNQDFVLAYQQRTDVKTICNIEKRVCMSGTLGGSFLQPSCKEDVVYDYHRAEVVSYNQKVLNEYIQPAAPVNSGAEFDTEGKINTPPETPTDVRGTTNSPVTNDSTVKQTPSPTKASCTTPRGQKIKHGQFIKAYKSPRGFIDLACNVELRACVNGKLKGSFTYSKCTFNNTTYADYLKAGSPASNTGFLFFQRIKKIFQ